MENVKHFNAPDHGRAIQLRRFELDVNQAELARAAGTAQSSISRLEKGKFNGSLQAKTKSKLSWALGVDIEAYALDLQKPQVDDELLRIKQENTLLRSEVTSLRLENENLKDELSRIRAELADMLPSASGI